MKKNKLTFHTLFQGIFLTSTSFASNDLVVYASSCAFGFLFSCFPVIMITLHILLRVFHISPDTIVEILNSGGLFNDTFQISRIIESVVSTKNFGLVELLLGVSLLWMARRLFASLMSGVRCIFHEKLQQQPLLFNIVILALEVIMVVFFAAVIIAIVTARSLYNFLPFQKLFPDIINTLNSALLAALPMMIMFIVVSFCYHFTPGTKPKWRLCFAFSALCTLIFFGFLKVFGLFSNITRYNLVYGVLSNIIILLLDVFTFFVLFLFFLQAIFVAQHFEMLLLAELYLLPPRSSTSLIDKLIRTLFIKPDHFVFRNPSLLEYQKGTVIFKPRDEGNSVYYVFQGNVEVQKGDSVSYFERGDFFGEVSCLLNETRKQKAIATSKTVLVRISSDTFLTMLDKNLDANKKALSNLSGYLGRQ